MTVQNIRKELKRLQTVDSKSELCPLREEFDVSVCMDVRVYVYWDAYKMTSLVV